MTNVQVLSTVRGKYRLDFARNPIYQHAVMLKLC